MVKAQNGFQRSLSHVVIPYPASCFQTRPANYTVAESSILLITTELLSVHPNKWTSICLFFLQKWGIHSGLSFFCSPWFWYLFLISLWKWRILETKTLGLASPFTVWLWWIVSHRGPVPYQQVKDWFGWSPVGPHFRDPYRTIKWLRDIHVETVDKGTALV